MSPDQVTTVTSQSWFSRLGNAVKGVMIGLLLFVVAFPLLYWNEGRSVRTFKTLKEGQGSVVSASPQAVNPAHDGKLVHLSGKAETKMVLQDPTFGVSATALKLRRLVEMYQWAESKKEKTEKKLGGGTETVTTYTYTKKWTSDTIDSTSFQNAAEHRNPGAMAHATQEWTADPVTVGAFTLSPTQLGQLDDYQPFSLPLPSTNALPEAPKTNFFALGNGFYLGRDAGNPQIGDLRITFGTVPMQNVSVIACQKGATFEPFTAKAGGTIDLVQPGLVSADLMFKKAQDANKVLTWLLRLAGFLLMFMGLSMVFKPLSVVADVVPLVGSIVGAGTGFIALLIAAGLSLVTIAIAWIAHRPVLGIGLLVAAAAVAFLVLRRMRAPKAAKPPPPAVAA